MPGDGIDEPFGEHEADLVHADAGAAIGCRLSELT
jgi:hypothetical protein